MSSDIKNKIVEDTLKHWDKIADIEIASNDGAFMLTPEAVESRDAYMKAFGIDRWEFLNSVYKPIIDAKRTK